MLTDLTAERLKIKHNEQALREIASRGNSHAKLQLATLLMMQSPEKDMECRALLHQVCAEENIDPKLKALGFTMLGDLALEKNSYMAAENYYKEAMDHGFMQAVEGIKSLYERGHLKIERHHDDYDYLYRKDITLAQKLSGIVPEIEKIRLQLTPGQKSSDAANIANKKAKKAGVKSRSSTPAI